MKRVLVCVSVLLMAMAAARPVQVVDVFPPDGSTSTHVDAIGAELNFTRGEPADPASLQLLVDGADVTPQSVVRMTRDWPPSSVWLSYTPIRLQLGTHRAEIRFRTEEGRMLAYAWTFTLTLPP